MRFSFAAVFALSLLAGPLAASADQPSAAMRVSDLAAKVLSPKPATCEDKEHACKGCRQGACDGCAEGECEAGAKAGCGACAKGRDAR